MAYRRTIEINPFSSKSINSAIMQLRREKTAIERNEPGIHRKRRTELVKLVAKKIAERVTERYGEVPNVNAKKYPPKVEYDGAMGRAWVSARGLGLFFIEYGTGVYATSGEGWKYGFFPGSWSYEHEQTFQTYMLSGQKAYADENGDYIYNNEAADAFIRAIGRLDEIVDEAAKEVYG